MTMRFSILSLGDNYAHLRSHEQFYHEVLDEAEYAAYEDVVTDSLAAPISRIATRSANDQA